jgi:hypothetical protein
VVIRSLRNEERPTQCGAFLEHDYVLVNAIAPRSAMDLARRFIELLQQREVAPRELLSKTDITRYEAGIARQYLPAGRHIRTRRRPPRVRKHLKNKD